MTFDADDAEGYSANRAGPSGFREEPGATEQAFATSAAGRLKSGPARSPFDAEGVRAWVEEVRGVVSAPALWRLAAALNEIDALRAAMAASEERVAELERLNRTWATLHAAGGPYRLGRWADDVFHAVPCDCDEDEEQVGENCMDGSDWTYGVFVSGGAFADRLVQKLPRIPPEDDEDEDEEAAPGALTPREQRIYAAGFEFGRKAAAEGARLAAERGLAGEGA